jgi:hypothetical protein
MRIVVAVVVGCVLLSLGHVARAEDAPRRRSEICLDGCNLAFDRCQAHEGVKPTGRCHIAAVKCKNDCPFELPPDPTAPPTVASHERCVSDCRDTYKKCLGGAESRRGGKCQADDVRCEKACPKPPEETAAVPASTGEGGAPGAPVAPAPVPTPAKRKMRVEGAAAPAPISATPAAPPAPIVQRQPAPVPTVRSADVAPSSSAPVGASAPVSASAAAPRAEPAEKRGFFGNLKCFFVSCEPPGSTACLKGCGVAYDECRALESKRGGECNTRLMNCRKDCRDAAALKR